MIKNVADKKAIEEQKEILKLKQDQRQSDLKFIMSHPQGIRFLKSFISELRIFDPSFTGGSETFFNEGKRSIGLKLIEEIRSADESKFLEIIKKESK